MRSVQTLIVLPTADSVLDERGQLVPNDPGKLRVAKAAELLTDMAEARLAISGDKQEPPAISDSQVYLEYLVTGWPHLAERVAFVDASSTFTAGDMVALAKLIDKAEGANETMARYATIIVVSHPDHARLALRSLNAGFQVQGDRTLALVESGEPPCRPSWQQALLHMVTKYDPRWEKPISWPLRFVARHDKRTTGPKTPSTP